MTKRHFIALADAIREYNTNAFASGSNITSPLQFTHTQIIALADFCQSQNHNFNRQRWLGYIAGENGPNGGKRATGTCKHCGNLGVIGEECPNCEPQDGLGPMVFQPIEGKAATK